MRLTSMKIHFVLAALLSVMGVACGGDDNNGDGTAGSGNTGGSGGGGGSGPGPGSAVVISDFETASTTDGVYDGYSEDAARGWKIAWFTYTDAGMNMSPGAMIAPAEMTRFVAVEDAGRAPGVHVANAKGGGFKAWGAGMGFNFISNPAPPPGSTDISAFTGVSFWIKANDIATGTVTVKIVDKQNTPADRGGTCVPAAPKLCDDVFVTKVVAKGEWTQVQRRWADFKQEGWGMNPFPAPELTAVIGIQFQVGTVATFDYSVDDVGLLSD